MDWLAIRLTGFSVTAGIAPGLRVRIGRTGPAKGLR